MSYLKHIQLSKQLEERAKEATKYRQLAEKEIEEATKEIEEAKKIDGNVTEAEAAFSEADDAVKGKDFKVALEKATDAKQKAIKAYQERSQTIVDSSMVLLNLAKDIGADTTKAEGFAKSAKEASKSNPLSRPPSLVCPGSSSSGKGSEKCGRSFRSRLGPAGLPAALGQAAR